MSEGSSDNLIHAMLVNLDQKITNGFDRVNQQLLEHNRLLSEHDIKLDTHTEEDRTAQQQVAALQVRVAELEKPRIALKHNMKTIGYFAVIAGIIAALIEIVRGA